MEKETKNNSKTTSTTAKKSSTAKKSTSVKKTTSTKKATTSKVASTKSTTTKTVASPKKTTKAAPKTASKKVAEVKTAKTAPKKVAKTSTVKKETKVGETPATKEEAKIGVKKVTNSKNTTEEKKVVAKENSQMIFNTEIGLLIKIILIIVGVLLIFFLLTNVIGKNKKDKPKETTTGQIQYDEILVSNILKQSNSSYYVLVYEKDDSYYEAYNTYITSYKAKEGATRVYTAVLSSGFNKSYIGKDSNTIGADVSNLKFKGTTLVRVENGSIVNAYEEPSTIIEHFSSIVK